MTETLDKEGRNLKVSESGVAAGEPAAPAFQPGDNGVAIIRGLENKASLPGEFKAAGTDLTIQMDGALERDSGNEARRQQVQTICRQMDELSLSDGRQQAMVVTSDSWNSTSGTMWLCERKDGHWLPTEKHWAVDLGRNGMAWGDGLLKKDDEAEPGNNGVAQKDDGALPNDNGPVRKHEGDGRAPAGVFEIGDAFGYNPSSPDGTKLPYRQATDNDFFVDDEKSPYYNTWQKGPAVNPDAGPSANGSPVPGWTSAETMHLKDNRYELGIVVKHNMDPPVPGDGSAIFLHEWRKYGETTSGCTSMAPENMGKLMRWLDPAKKPLLVQLPAEPGAMEQFGKMQIDSERESS